MNLTKPDKDVINRLRRVDHLGRSLKQLAERAEAALDKAREERKAILQEREAIDRIIAEKTTNFPWLSDAIAQYHEACTDKVADYLDEKLRPARSSASKVREISAEKRKYEKRYRLLRNRVKYYEKLFPWLQEYVAEGIDELVCSVEGQVSEDHEDPVRDYLSNSEYRKLPSVERNQRALDRYWKSRRRPWQLGRDYERFIGYKWERAGYRVHYHGIVEGLGDLGRDLIAEKDGRTEIIQCKYWRPERLVREKHIFQLYGTMVEYWMKNSESEPVEQRGLFEEALEEREVVPVFVTSAVLSADARRFADVLGVEVYEQYAFDINYPCIKCNVSRSTGKKIYHLPMDQKYDDVVIEPDRGEFYAATVWEAEEENGFRRAWRWKGGQASAAER